MVNIGDDVFFPNSVQGDPLPRTVRVGVSLDLQYDLGSKIQPFGVKFVRSAENYLGRYVDGEFRFDSGLGEINFYDHVLSQKTTDDIIVNRGMEISLFETLHYREGRYVDSSGKIEMDTYGYEFSFVGVLQLVGVLELIENDASSTGRYFDVSYIISGYSPDGWGSNHPLSGTEFQSIQLEVSNLPELLSKL